MRVSIVGTGYVGLVTGACLSDIGHTVICVDNDEQKVSQIRKGVAPIHEAGLDDMLSRNIGKNLTVTSDLGAAVLASEITLIAVGTPFDGANIDLSYVESVSREIGAALSTKTGYHAVFVKSTVIPGTTDGLVRSAIEQAAGRKAGEAFGIGMNPEFLTEGQALRDFMNPDRIVIGGIDDRTIDTAAGLYESFADKIVIRTNNKTAEMIKYTSNALLATSISFANEIANLCTRIGGIDASDVMDGVHRSHYLTVKDANGTERRAPLTRYLSPGCGFGGSCLPKDVQALIAFGEQAGCDMSVLRSVIDVNRRQPGRVLEAIDGHFTTLEGVRVAILGLSFKPDTDDVRESPAFPIMDGLLARGAVLSAYDPVANEAARAAYGDDRVRYCEQLTDLLEDAEIAVLVTRWREFAAVPDLIAGMNRSVLLVDGRRMLDKGEIKRYEGIGLSR